ncbi:MAG: ShlB/FhaC/HecB family hemolysin secretion/activation protein [Chitinophagaceae bacterium]
MHPIFAQQKKEVVGVSKKRDTTIVAGSQYGRSALHQWLWGKHYRKEWITPVKVSLFYLDTANGGLTPYASGGGRQSKTLRLHDDKKREYVLRSIDKTYGGAVPDIFLNTFVERLVDDQVSTAHPYAALTIPLLAEKAKIFHTTPRIVFVPKQSALDTFNNEFGDNLYLFEKRPDENWETASNFGNSKNIISTEKLLQNLLEKSNSEVDQLDFVRARLFDLFIGDWGRHEDQWRWAEFDKGDKIIYKPIPRDRDQTYTKFDGLLVKVGLAAGNLGNLQSFDKKIKDVNLFNFPARNLDRRMTNETTWPQWLAIAQDLQKLLTDDVIEASVNKLPPELFSLSGPTIISNLKAHRNDLVAYANTYYHFLAKEVDIPGTAGNEVFVINRLNDSETSVSIFSKKGTVSKDATPFYTRIFTAADTKEIRLYGIEGNDVFNVIGSADNNITVRMIGGEARDSFEINSVTANKKKIQIYDDAANDFLIKRNAKLHLSTDSNIHKYVYDGFTYDKSGISPMVFYSNEDRFYVGLGYGTKTHRWRNEPFRSKQNIALHYSLSQNAIGVIYKGVVNQFIGKWNLALNASYDAVSWTNFYGIGNETIMAKKDVDFYRMRTREGFASIGLEHKLGQFQKIGFATTFQTVAIINDKNRFVALNFAGDPQLFKTSYYGGGQVTYTLQKTNEMLVPSRGVSFFGTAAYAKNLKVSDRSIGSLDGTLNMYFPLSKFILAITTGATTVSGKPAFYQLPNIGGGLTLRGYRRERFYGKTAFYNINELQWVTPVKSFLFNGRFGLLTFYDQGRVWQPGENSNQWHSAYGGGFLIVPFEKLMVSVSYGKSKEAGLINLRFRTNLPL